MPDDPADFDEAVARARKVVANGSTDLVPLGAAAPEVVRESYGAQRADAERAIAALKASAEARADELRRKLRDQEAALRAELAPLMEMAARLKEGIWTVNLYLGRDEAITMLADGDPAPPGTPITLRQLVLAMDEECLIAAEEGGVDARRVDDFGAWITADRRHLDQVLPERKGVVVLVPSRQRREYGGMFANAAMAKENQRSHWLIRNGDRVYLMVTDLDVGDRLVPTRAEFLDFFYRDRRWGEPAGDRIPLDPGSEEWVKAERAAGDRRRHFMRIMLVLQGLVDRTTVFQPLPAPVNFLSVGSQDDGRVVIVNELDNVLTSGRPSFREWQQELMTRLRPGMRIVGAFSSQRWRDLDGEWGHERLNPARAPYPSSNVIHVIEEKTRYGLVLRYKRNDTVHDHDQWGRYQGQRKPKKRASCLIKPEDEFILPVDLVDEADLEVYLHARTERHQYLYMVPVIRAVLRAKREERQAEAPFRLMLAGRLAAAHNLDVAEVEDELSALVDWWKLANRWHRPLVGDPKAEAKAVDAIGREFTARRAAAARGGPTPMFEQRTVDAIRRDHPAAICVARRRDGRYAAFVPANDGNVWLHEHRYTDARPAGLRQVETREWVQVPGRTRAASTELWVTDRWTGWDHDASRADHLTDPERDQLVEQVLNYVEPLGTPIAVVQEGREFTAYAWPTDQVREVFRIGSGMSREAWEPGDRMTSTRASWRRGQGGAVLLVDVSERRVPVWRRYDNPEFGCPTPWEPSGRQRARLRWLDDTQRERVLALYTEIEQREQHRRELVSQCNDARRALAARWERAEWKRQYERFLTDFGGAADLWEGHKKTLNVNFPWPNGLTDVIDDVVCSGIELAGMTVADAVTLSKNGTRVRDLPEHIASLPLTDPDEPADVTGEV